MSQTQMELGCNPTFSHLKAGDAFSLTSTDFLSPKNGTGRGEGHPKIPAQEHVGEFSCWSQKDFFFTQILRDPKNRWT